jgi:predicted MPP superfamily phosphohydrolase
VDPARRVFLARAAAGAVTVSAGSASAWGVRNAALPVAVKRVEVTLPRLPAAMGGFTIVQLTDLHLGPLLGREWLEGIVRRTNALKPDLIAITGDLVDGRVSTLGSTTAQLAKLRAPHGVYFVTGNHEYYSGAPQWCAELTRLGIRVLRNERVSIGKGKDSFDLAGIDDHNARRHLPDHGPDLARAVRGRDATRELILLAHQPRAIHEAAEHGVGLALCGHTHGGQLWPWTFFVGLQQPYVSGLHRHGETTQIYVSEGTGYWGPPMRLGTRCEITRVVLRAG